MIYELDYPFDSKMILKKKKSLKRKLLENKADFLEKKIAVLGGSTTHEIIMCMELFLLKQGIKPIFYQSEYGMFYEDAVFGNDELDNFNPDIIYIHTSNCNITLYPEVFEQKQDIEEKLENEYSKYNQIWLNLKEKFNCPIIQNNFEYPYFRYLGNKDASDIHGRINYISKLNDKFNKYAQENSGFYINDINYLSAYIGLEKWSDRFYWHMYKYCLSMDSIPYLAHSVSNIIKALYGKNKKAFALDLDNTLWGGIIGDDGIEGIEIGPETSIGQAYLEFQEYIKNHKNLGIILNVVSKNDEDNAIIGLNHESSQIKPDDLIVLKANWEPKSQNIQDMIETLSLTEESFVFVDDNPAEREIVKQNLKEVAVPEITSIDNYIKNIDRNGYFEIIELSNDDLKRNEMYKENVKRQNIQKTFVNYKDYLISLEMQAEINEFNKNSISRITQLINKSNQFNLTTKRYTLEEVEKLAEEEDKITIYGKLADKFGDNGIISVVQAKIMDDVAHIELWLMSCRVLKRDMEFAMMDNLIEKCLKKGIKKIKGYYIKSSKNNMVKDFYEKQGFNLIKQNEDNTIWEFKVSSEYVNKNEVIKIL